jgi:riboflavin synthase
MFTGIVEEIGRIESASRGGSFATLVIGARTVLEGTRIGDSISVHGACQTVTEIGDSSFTVQSVEETIRRSTLGALKRGSRVNLERSIKAGDRFGGHIVMGHVDCTGRVVKTAGTRENILLTIALPGELSRFVAEKGSITIDGVSLTVSHAAGVEFGVSVIPHTLGATTLSDLRTGDQVNLEVDIIARYVDRLMAGGGTLTIDRLAGMGF